MFLAFTGILSVCGYEGQSLSTMDEAAKKAPAEYWLVDGVHPSAAGHKLLTDAWVKATEGIR